jgi:hypothetical protein
VDVRRNEMTRWALWREVLPNSDSGLEPITGDRGTFDRPVKLIGYSSLFELILFVFS